MIGIARGIARSFTTRFLPVFTLGEAMIVTTGLVIGVNQALIGEPIQPAINKIETVSKSVAAGAPFEFLAGAYGFLGEMAESGAIIGMRFGYAYPGIGKPLAYILPFVLMAVGGIFGIKVLGGALRTVGESA